MPPTEEALNNALDDLRQTELVSFISDPDAIGPFGESELRWNVRAPARVKLRLNGRPVPMQGSQTVRPVQTRSYTLTANATGGLHAQLGQRVVSVDTTACVADEITEADVRAQVLTVVGQMLADDDNVKERRPTTVEVTPDGIELKIRLEIERTNARNPDFNIDALIGVNVDETGLVAFFRKFEADLDFSFWEDVLNFTIGAFVGGPFLHLAIAIAESNAQTESRRAILDGIQGAIDLISLLIPDGWAPHRVVMNEGSVDVWRCPQPDRAVIKTFMNPKFKFVLQATPPT